MCVGRKNGEAGLIKGGKILLLTRVLEYHKYSITAALPSTRVLLSCTCIFTGTIEFTVITIIKKLVSFATRVLFARLV